MYVMEVRRCDASRGLMGSLEAAKAGRWVVVVVWSGGGRGVDREDGMEAKSPLGGLSRLPFRARLWTTRRRPSVYVPQSLLRLRLALCVLVDCAPLLLRRPTAKSTGTMASAHSPSLNFCAEWYVADG